MGSSVFLVQVTVRLWHRALMQAQWMATRWTGAAWCCTDLLPSPPVTCSLRQARAPAWGASHAASPRLPVTPSPLAAPYSLTAPTLAARSALWTRTPVAARWPAQTATRPTRGAATPTATMTQLDPDGWRPRPERQRRGAGLEALTGRRGRASSAPRGGQCLLPQSPVVVPLINP